MDLVLIHGGAEHFLDALGIIKILNFGEPLGEDGVLRLIVLMSEEYILDLTLKQLIHKYTFMHDLVSNRSAQVLSSKNLNRSSVATELQVKNSITLLAATEAALEIAKEAGFSITAEDLKSHMKQAMSDAELESAAGVDLYQPTVVQDGSRTRSCDWQEHLLEVLLLEEVVLSLVGLVSERCLRAGLHGVSVGS